MTLLALLALLVLRIEGAPSAAQDTRSRALIGALLAIGAFIYFLFYHISKLDMNQTTPQDDLPIDRVLAIQRRAGREQAFNPAQVRLFALMLTAPWEVRQRVSEEYSTEQRTLQQKVFVDHCVPKRILGDLDGDTHKDSYGLKSEIPEEEEKESHTIEPGELVLLPVVVPYKAVLLDSFHVEDSDGTKIPTLTYGEYLEVAATVLSSLFELVYTEGLIDARRRNEAIALEFKALELITQRGNVEPKRVRAVVDAIKALVPEGNNPTLNLAARMVSKLAVSYAIIVAIALPQDRRISVRYRRTFIPELKLRSSHTNKSSLLGPVRILLGARPVDLKLSIANAWTCQSYHLRVYAPEGLYLGAQNGDDLKRYQDEVRPGSPTTPYWRFRRRLGQSYAHVYVRYFPEPLEDSEDHTEPIAKDAQQAVVMDGKYPPRTEPGISLQFWEVPPGSILRAAVAAVSLAALVWPIAYFSSRLGHVETDAPAFLLAFPAVVAGWLGFDAPTRRLFEGTLAARLSLLFTAFLSIAASVVFIAQKSGIPEAMPAESPLTLPLLGDINALGVIGAWWTLLVFFALVNAASTTFLCIQRTWIYVKLAGRPRKTDVSTTQHI